MLTLMDIDRLTDSHDGSVYSDLYKDVYGSRPRGITFDSIEEFDQSYQMLANRLQSEQAWEEEQQRMAFCEFENRVAWTRRHVQNCYTRAHAVQIIADAEGIKEDDLKFYGWEVLENELGLKYGSIKEFLEPELDADKLLAEIEPD